MRQTRRSAAFDFFPRLWVITGAILAWGALGIWADYKLGWPALQGAGCSGGCYTNELLNSWILLKRGGALELLMFVWLWSWPAAVIFRIALWLVRQVDRNAP